MTRWQKTVAAAKADPTLRDISGMILAENRRIAAAGGIGRIEPLLLDLFSDRVQDLDLYVPNAAYLGILRGAVYSAIRGN